MMLPLNYFFILDNHKLVHILNFLYNANKNVFEESMLASVHNAENRKSSLCAGK